MSLPTRPLGEIADVNWGNTSITKVSYVDIGHPAFSASGSDGLLPTYEFNEKGIVLSAIGARCGRCFRANGKWTAIKNTITIVQRAPNLIDIDYLFHFLNDPTVWVQKGGGQPFISLSDARNVKVPLPPLATQQHIARVLEQADQLRKQAQQMEGELNKLAQSLFLEMFGDPVANPFNWKESTLGDSCRKITDGTHHSPPLISEGVPYITAKHLKEWGLDFLSDPTYVSQESHEQIYSRCAPEQGDVLYIKDGATTGIAALNEYSFQFSMLSSLALLKPDENLLLSTYLCHWLNSPKVKTVMLSNMAGAGITRLTLTKIKDAKILLPPIEKQKQFELRLREIHSFTINAREQIRKCNDLFGALMQRAFNGELTAPERKAA